MNKRTTPVAKKRLIAKHRKGAQKLSPHHAPERWCNQGRKTKGSAVFAQCVKTACWVPIKTQCSGVKSYIPQNAACYHGASHLLNSLSCDKPTRISLSCIFNFFFQILRRIAYQSHRFFPVEYGYLNHFFQARPDLSNVYVKWLNISPNGCF